MKLLATLFVLAVVLWIYVLVLWLRAKALADFITDPFDIEDRISGDSHGT